MKGLSLIELLVVIVVVAVITTIAIPNYQGYVARSRRADAMISLQRVANEQEQFYFDGNRYSTNLASLNLTNVSPDGYYNLSIPTANISLFIARAVPVADSSQAGEGRFEIRSNGQKSWDPGEDGIYECSWENASSAVDHC